MKLKFLIDFMIFEIWMIFQNDDNNFAAYPHKSIDFRSILRLAQSYIIKWMSNYWVTLFICSNVSSIIYLLKQFDLYFQMWRAFTYWKMALNLLAWHHCVVTSPHEHWLRISIWSNGGGIRWAKMLKFKEKLPTIPAAHNVFEQNCHLGSSINRETAKHFWFGLCFMNHDKCYDPC